MRLALTALVVFALLLITVFQHDQMTAWVAIVLIGLISLIYMAFYFHIALRWFGDNHRLQWINVGMTIIILSALQHVSQMTAEIALLYMLVVSITGLRLGLVAGLATAVASVGGSLIALLALGALPFSSWFFVGFQLVVYVLTALLSSSLALTLRAQADETVRRNRNLALLLEMSSIGSSLDLDFTLPEMAAKIVDGLSASFCSIHLLEQDGRELVTAAAYSVLKEDLGSLLGRRRALTAVPWHRKAIETQQVMIFRQDKPYMRIRDEEFREMMQPGAQSVCLIPLVVDGQPLGIISVGERRNWEREHFDDLRLDLLVSIGAQAGVVVNNARLHQSIRQQVQRMEVLHEVTRAITSTIEMNSLVEIMYQQINRVITAETYMLGLYEKGDDVIDMRVIIDVGQRFPSYRMPYGAGFTSHVIRSRKPLLIRHLSVEKDELPVKGVLLGADRLSESWLGVPIFVNDEVTGVLVVASYRPNAFQDEDVALLTSMAGQAALALNNARRHAEVEEQSRRDSLTGVYNHSYFVQRLNEEVDKARQNNEPISLIMLDIDFFKNYNDTYGHVTGDQVLRTMVQAILAHMRKTDLVGRWGGEEFAIAMPGLGLDAACILATSIRQTLADLPIVVNDHSVPGPTVSQGIATFPQHAPSASQLVDVADRALYDAKKQGRDKINAATLCAALVE